MDELRRGDFIEAVHAAILQVSSRTFAADIHAEAAQALALTRVAAVHESVCDYALASQGDYLATVAKGQIEVLQRFLGVWPAMSRRLYGIRESINSPAEAVAEPINSPAGAPEEPINSPAGES